MYRKEKTYAVTCTVPEIGSAHERIELTAEHALRKNGGGKSNVTSQNGCEVGLHSVSGATDQNRTGDVGGAAFVLAARVDQKQSVGVRLQVGIVARERVVVR